MLRPVTLSGFRRSALLALVLLSASAGAAEARGCGTAGGDYLDEDPNTGGGGARITYVKGLSCRSARTVVRRCYERERVKGWRASTISTAPLRVRLRSGTRVIVLRDFVGGGLTCHEL